MNDELKEKVYAGLLAVRLLLSSRRSWTKREAARDFYGKGVFPDSKAACKWCLLGAFATVVSNNEAKGYGLYAVGNAVRRLYEGTYLGVLDFNDAKITTHKDVLEVLDAAIEAIDD